MNYLVIKSDLKKEYRIYIDNNIDNIEGDLIYKGHKLGFPDKLLSDIIYYKIEKITNNIFYLNYELWDGTSIPSNIESINWRLSKGDVINDLLDCWSSILIKSQMLLGNFKNISITKINI